MVDATISRSSVTLSLPLPSSGSCLSSPPLSLPMRLGLALLFAIFVAVLPDRLVDTP